MSLNLSLGMKGESLAANYLVENGYTLITKNYRAGRGEIDLIVQKDDILVFVEVKLRNGKAFGFPEDFVGSAKQEKVIQTAEMYLEEIDWKHDIRFDIIAVFGEKIEHFVDAF